MIGVSVREAPCFLCGGRRELGGRPCTRCRREEYVAYLALQRKGLVRCEVRAVLKAAFEALRLRDGLPVSAELAEERANSVLQVLVGMGVVR